MVVTGSDSYAPFAMTMEVTADAALHVGPPTLTNNCNFVIVMVIVHQSGRLMRQWPVTQFHSMGRWYSRAS